MPNLYEQLITSTAEDGASALCGAFTIPGDREVDELMGAWLEERHDAIESRMFMDRACQLLSRILVEGELSPQAARSARTLIRAVKAAKRADKRR